MDNNSKKHNNSNKINMQGREEELFKRALSEAMDSKICELEKKSEDKELPPPSKSHKKRMNRLFRERVGGDFLPFPEADNLYERIRSKLVIKLKINELLDKRKKRR
ncbi:MAG: hypothetical protein IJW48_04330 [Clostridia bacterium]|nr:hypothetical protein [Clostridia bacterium]